MSNAKSTSRPYSSDPEFWEAAIKAVKSGRTKALRVVFDELKTNRVRSCKADFDYLCALARAIKEQEEGCVSDETRNYLIG